jgi:hypothetical protein
MLELIEKSSSGDLAQITKDLTSLVAFHNTSLKHAQESLSQIFVRTYLWIQEMTKENPEGSFTVSIGRLASVLKEPQNRVTSWYRHGGFMVQHGIPDTANSALIQRLNTYANTLDERDLLFGIELVKSDGRLSDIDTLGKRAKSARTTIASPIGDPDKKGLRQSLKSTLLQAERTLRKEGLRIDVVDADGRVLETVQ